jgi:hypothetical protein
MPIPKPNKGESKDNYISRFMSSEIMKKEYPDEKQRLAIAYSEWRKHQESNKEMILEYFVPIAEFSGQLKENEDFSIQGIAINETTTSNGHKFLAEELRLAAPTLGGVPLLKDHNNSVDAIMGRVTYSEFNEMQNNILFRANVMDETMKKMIKDGRINSVSVGAIVRDIEEKNGELIPRGIIFRELSLVAVSADQSATFNVALKEAWDKHIQINNTTNEKGGETMADADQKTEVNKTVSVAEKIESAAEKVEEKTPIAEVNESETDKLLKEILAKLNKEFNEEAKVEVKEVVQEVKTEEASEMSFIETCGSLKGGAITVQRKLR